MFVPADKWCPPAVNPAVANSYQYGEEAAFCSYPPRSSQPGDFWQSFDYKGPLDLAKDPLNGAYI